MSGETIDLLVIEDNPGDALIVKEVLKDDTKAVFDVTVAPTFAKATEEMEGKRYAAVLLDMSLPDGNGLEMVRKTVELAPESAILVLTGRADESMAKQALEIGAQDYLLKLQIFGPELGVAIHLALDRQAQKQ